MSIESELFEIVRELPGITSPEVAELMPHVKRQSIYAGLENMRVKGLTKRERSGPNGFHGRPLNRWWVNETGNPPKPKRKIATPQPVDCSTVAWKEMQAKIDELEAWKAKAIARFPDLAVSEIVIKARQIVAAECEDKNSAEQVLRGNRDATVSMRVAIKLLEAAA